MPFTRINLTIINLFFYTILIFSYKLILQMWGIIFNIFALFIVLNKAIFFLLNQIMTDVNHSARDHLFSLLMSTALLPNRLVPHWRERSRHKQQNYTPFFFFCKLEISLFTLFCFFSNIYNYNKIVLKTTIKKKNCLWAYITGP